MTIKKPRAAGKGAASRRPSSRTKTSDTRPSTAIKLTRKPLPFVRPGQHLRYVQKLKERDCWPPSRGKRCRMPNERRPTITPYIIVPAVSGDAGTRPIADQHALYNASIQIVDAGGNSVLAPIKGSTYSVRCRITNRGGAGAYGGLAEFYIAPPSVFDNLAVMPGGVLRANGYVGFSAVPGGTVTVECPRPWIPATDDETTSSILVQAYDAFVDTVVRRFDARQDCHVGRRDHIPDFSGIWDGMESANIIHGVPTLIRIVITQNYLDVNVGFYSQLGGGIPSTPQDSAGGTILNRQVNLFSTEYWGPAQVPFTSNQWSLTITPSGLLHFEHHRHYLMPGDGRPDTYSSGDLHRL